MRLGASQDKNERKVQAHLHQSLGTNELIGYHDHQPDALTIWTAGVIPLVPDKMLDVKIGGLIRELTTQGAVRGNDDSYSRGLDQNRGEDGNGLPRTCGKNGDNAVVFGIQDGP